MIVIVSPSESERAALAALGASRGWPVSECDSIHALSRILRRASPKVVVLRHKLSDGYSDNAIAALSGNGAHPAAKIIILLRAGTPTSVEARQIALGADCVQRDPVRMEILIEYIEKYRRDSRSDRAALPARPKNPAEFAGARLHADERVLRHGSKTAQLTPREVELVELLAGAGDRVVTYETLFTEILGRRFRGDTSNMRVLLGKLGASVAPLGIVLRDWVEVIPKLGYRYHASRPDQPAPTRLQPAAHFRA